ncbi:hypothetical protein [Larkinella soli]|uniref:hypothetical protein n=1 Tax=Larkinella soli TaxID=1770527 RepID=UPI000FFCA599|nr:hypothetical protein [Larkinella soli]
MEQPTELITTTVTSLNDGGITSIIPPDAFPLLDQWLDTLEPSGQTQQIITSLNDLKSQIDSGNPDAVVVRTILLDLSDQTSVLASNADADLRRPLADLADAIQTLATSL